MKLTPKKKKRGMDQIFYSHFRRVFFHWSKEDIAEQKVQTQLTPTERMMARKEIDIALASLA